MVLLGDKKLSDDSLFKIFGYLNASELAAIEVCCTRWRRVATNEQFWEDHLERLYQQKGALMNVPEEIHLMQRVKSLSMAALKQALHQVNIMNCIEKIDYQRSLFAYLFFRRRHYPTNFPYKLVLPSWCLTRLTEGKGNYYFARQEMNRKTILKAELTSIHWTFHFKQNEHEGGWDCRFFNDFTMESQLHGQTMKWQFLEYDVIDGGDSVQVEQFPPLKISRKSDGQWMMENPHVRMLQQITLPPDQVPLM